MPEFIGIKLQFFVVVVIVGLGSGLHGKISRIRIFGSSTPYPRLVLDEGDRLKIII